MAHIQCSRLMPAPRSQVFELLTEPMNLSDLLKDTIEVEPKFSLDQVMRKGAEFSFVMTRFGLSQPVTFRVEDYIKGSRLTYKQAEGLMYNWYHTMKFEDFGDKQTLVTDLVEFELPFGIFGHIANDLFVKSDLKNVLEKRLFRAEEILLNDGGTPEESSGENQAPGGLKFQFTT